MRFHMNRKHRTIILPGKSTGTRKAFFKNEMSSAKPHFCVDCRGVFCTAKTAAHLHCCIATAGNHLFSNDPSKSYQLVEAKFRIVCTVGTLAGELGSTDESKWLKKLAELRADPFFAPQRPSGKISQLIFFEAPHHKAYTGPRGANHGYPWHNSPT